MRPREEEGSGIAGGTAGLHDLRHSYATAAPSAGVPAKVVSERFGYSTLAITLEIYSHVLPGIDEAAAARVANLILGLETTG